MGAWRPARGSGEEYCRTTSHKQKKKTKQTERGITRAAALRWPLLVAATLKRGVSGHHAGVGTASPAPLRQPLFDEAQPLGSCGARSRGVTPGKAPPHLDRGATSAAASRDTTPLGGETSRGFKVKVAPRAPPHPQSWLCGVWVLRVGGTRADDDHGST